MWQHTLFLMSLVWTPVCAGDECNRFQDSSQTSRIEQLMAQATQPTIPQPTIPQPTTTPVPTTTPPPIATPPTTVPSCNLVYRNASPAQCPSGRAMYQVCSDGSEAFVRCR
jgi:hypothetical protein